MVRPLLSFIAIFLTQQFSFIVPLDRIGYAARPMWFYFSILASIRLSTAHNNNNNNTNNNNDNNKVAVGRKETINKVYALFGLPN